MIDGVRLNLEIRGAGAARVAAGATSSSRRPTPRPTSWTSSSADAHTVYHPVGTCAMGSVVDAELRVLRPGGPARRGRVGHADDHPRQHERPDDHDRREGRGPHPRPRSAAARGRRRRWAHSRPRVPCDGLKARCRPPPAARYSRHRTSGCGGRRPRRRRAANRATASPSNSRRLCRLSSLSITGFSIRTTA